MDWLKEFLGEELYKQVTEKLKGNDKVKLVNNATGEYIEKSKYSEVEQKAKTLSEQLSQRDKDIKDLKKKSEGNEELQTKLTELQKQYQTDTDKLNSTLSKVKLDNAIELALVGLKAKNVTATKALLNLEGVKLVDDKVLGLDEQLKDIKEKNTYLFEAENIKQNYNPTGGKSVDYSGDLNSAIKDKDFNFTEFLEAKGDV